MHNFIVFLVWMSHKHDFEIKLNVSLFGIFYIKRMGFKTRILDLGSLSAKARCATKILVNLIKYPNTLNFSLLTCKMEIIIATIPGCATTKIMNMYQISGVGHRYNILQMKTANKEPLVLREFLKLSLFSF